MKNKQVETLTEVNALLEQLNHSLSQNDEQVRSIIQLAYVTINRPEKLSQRYKQIPDSLREMVGSFQELAVAKQYHFSKEQNETINKLRTLSRDSWKDSAAGIINGAVW